MLKQIAEERLALKQIREKYSKTPRPGVSIITPTNKPIYIDNILNNFINSRYLYKELIIILNNNNMNIDYYKIKTEWLKHISIFQLDERNTLGDCLNYGIAQARYDYITKMDDDDYYGPNYLIDLMNVFKYTDAEVVGKLSCFIYFEDNNTLYARQSEYTHQYVKSLNGSNLLVKKEVFNKVKFNSLTLGEDTQFLVDCENIGIKIYAADRFNYVCIRNKDLQNHTWKAESEALKSVSEKILTTSNYIPIVTA